MAQNLFEKYGIKEVADVTLYRIERKDETFESQREISISSILKGALTKQVVYPLDEDGKGEVDGYEAYVFKDADVLTHFNYDCDDSLNLKGTALYVDKEQITKTLYKKDEKDEEDTETADTYTPVTVLPENTTIVPGTYYINKEDGNKEDLIDYLTEKLNGDDDEDTIKNLFDTDYITIKSLLETSTDRDIRERAMALIAKGYKVSNVKIGIGDKYLAYKGTTSNTVTAGEEDLVKWVSYLTGPMTFAGDSIGRFTILYNEILKNGGELLFNENVTAKLDEKTGEYVLTVVDESEPIVLKGGTLVIGAPFNASGDEIRNRYNAQYANALESTGTIYHFTQPVRTNDAYDDVFFNGTINMTVVVAADTESVTDEDTTYDLVVTFNNVKLTAEEYALIHKDAIEEADISDLKKILGYPGVVVTVEDSEASVESIIEAFTSVEDVEVIAEPIYNKFLIYFTLTLDDEGQTRTGIWKQDSKEKPYYSYVSDPDYEGEGTHEFSYATQICMLFAKNQNLITKTGNRYRFADPDGMFGAFDFDDNFAAAPNSTERVVVVGLAGRISENLYDFDEINEAIRDINTTLAAKAYDITYTDYAELVVEDEMGFYLPQQLGGSMDKKLGEVITFANSATTYGDWAKSRKGIDIGLYGAIYTWADDDHYSINDAIDALKQEQKIIDGSGEVYSTGFTRVFGGYKVQGHSIVSQPIISDIYPVNGKGGLGTYDDFTINGEHIKDPITGKQVISNYALEDVLEKLATANFGEEIGDLRISSTNPAESNRAIYIDPDNGALSNRAFIYLLKNVNGKALGNDKNGIFEFYDKKGNRVYYQDRVFAGTAYLALVVIGTRGLIFVVDRHCTKNFSQVAWMINDNGYITDKQAKRIVKNGLIHTVTVTACDESFDATCTVGSIKVRKTKKNVLRYVPVLFLDTLKVSTIEQASETTDATGGRGNAKLITWDYGKEITLSLEDALFTPASMAAIWAGEHGDLKNGVKDTTMIDRMEKITAKRSFIVPAGNQEGTPTEGDITAQAVYYDPKTMEPFQDGTPIAEGEVIYKFTRSVAYEGNSIGNTIEISADKFPGTYRVVGETFVRDKTTGEDQRFQFIIPEAKMSAEDSSITLEADGDPVVFDFTMTVLRPDNGVMMKFVQFDVEENTEENDGSTMVKDTENLNLLDDAEMYKVSGSEDEELVIGATEY